MIIFAKIIIGNEENNIFYFKHDDVAIKLCANINE